jgi:hypothetical protein
MRWIGWGRQLRAMACGGDAIISGQGDAYLRTPLNRNPTVNWIPSLPLTNGAKIVHGPRVRVVKSTALEYMRVDLTSDISFPRKLKYMSRFRAVIYNFSNGQASLYKKGLVCL